MKFGRIVCTHRLTEFTFWYGVIYECIYFKNLFCYLAIQPLVCNKLSVQCSASVGCLLACWVCVMSVPELLLGFFSVIDDNLQFFYLTICRCRFIINTSVVLCIVADGRAGRFPWAERQGGEGRIFPTESYILCFHRSTHSVLGSAGLVDDENVRHWLALIYYCCCIPRHCPGWLTVCAQWVTLSFA